MRNTWVTPGTVTEVLLVWVSPEVSRGAIGRLWDKAESSGREPRAVAQVTEDGSQGTLTPTTMKQPKGSQKKTWARIRQEAGATQGDLSVAHEL